MTLFWKRKKHACEDCSVRFVLFHRWLYFVICILIQSLVDKRTKSSIFFYETQVYSLVMCVQMEALISHSSKSYYACVGESTHAYQSPSKDLTAINNRLNGYAFLHALNIWISFILLKGDNLGYSCLIPCFSNRKVRGPLNFDDVDIGLVSDSMVANSLYLQNGSCASSSGAPLKSEQPDS